jgi:hypothetical protein
MLYLNNSQKADQYFYVRFKHKVRILFAEVNVIINRNSI